jgi:hypothetical protein
MFPSCASRIAPFVSRRGTTFEMSCGAALIAGRERAASSAPISAFGAPLDPRKGAVAGAEDATVTVGAIGRAEVEGAPAARGFVD